MKSTFSYRAGASFRHALAVAVDENYRGKSVVEIAWPQREGIRDVQLIAAAWIPSWNIKKMVTI